METTEKTSIATEGKNIAVIAYITVIGLIIAFIMNNDKKEPFASFHIKQSLGLALTGFALGVIGIIPIIGWLINIIGIFVLLYMWIMGLINAINGTEKVVPILGEKYAEWFKSL
ncbi:MAG TPA: hypothetical protein VKY41_10650 [Xanthomarina sp.]|nr:hypothetical protein [Xanthomarina sp.]